MLLLLLLPSAGCDRGSATDKEAAIKALKPANPVEGSVTLSWSAPTRNSDGSRLADLAGYRIYYGTSREYFQRVIEINDPSVTEYTIKNLPPYTYYFAITAYSASGAESQRSNVQTKTVH